VKRLPVAWVAFILLWLAAPIAKADPADDAKIAAISQTLDLLHAAAAKADGKTYFDLFAPDAVFIGTDASERWTMDQFRAYALPLFAQGKGWTYKPRLRHVTVARVPCSCIAWFDEISDSASYGTSPGYWHAGAHPIRLEDRAICPDLPHPKRHGEGNDDQDQGARS
jgi:hypothetical protein